MIRTLGIGMLAAMIGFLAEKAGYPITSWHFWAFVAYMLVAFGLITGGKNET